MSIIFNTLKKIKSQSPEGPDSPKSLVEQKREIYSLPNLLSSPFMLLVLVLAGTGLFYGFYHFKGYMDRSRSTGVSDTVKPGLQIKDEPLSSPSEKKDEYTFISPQEVTAQPLAESSASTDAQPRDPFHVPPEPVPTSSAEPDSPGLPPREAQFSQSGHNAPKDARMTFLPGREPRRELTKIGHNTAGDSPPKIDKGAPTVPGDEIAPIEEQSPPQSNTTIAGLEPSAAPYNRIERIHVLPEAGDPSDLFQEPLSPARFAEKTNFSSSVSTFSDSRGSAPPGESAESLFQKNLENERIQTAKVRKCSKIARIVTKLETSMRDADENKSEVLVNQLTQLKGSESAYILKVKAFMLVQKKEYASAAPLLSSVLEKNKNDLEAGINMAIVEANTNQIERAKSRLNRLSKIYPSNSLVPAILDKME